MNASRVGSGDAVFCYRVTKRLERYFIDNADSIVTLTKASVPHLRKLSSSPAVQIDVIPTCTDVARFAKLSEIGRPNGIWNGSLGTWYRFDLGLDLAEVLGCL